MGRMNGFRAGQLLHSEWTKWLLLSLVSILFVGLGPRWVFDDAYMFLRYTHNILKHGVCGWNSDEASYGCTSLGYLGSNVVLASLGLDRILSGSKLLQYQGIGYLGGFLLICMRLPKIALQRTGGRLGPWMGLFIAISAIWGLRMQINGMDTLMSVFANGLVVWAAFHWRNQRSLTALLLLCLSGYFAFWVRPDSFFYFMLLPPLLLWAWRARSRDWAFWGMGASFLMAIHCLGTYLYFGTVLPIPFFVKASGFFEAYIGIGTWNSQSHFNQFLWQFSPLFIIFLRGFLHVPLRKLLPFLLPFLLTNLYLMGKVQIMGYHGRYFAPSFPMLLAMVLVIADGGGLRSKAWAWRAFRPWLASVAAFLIASLGIKVFGDWNFARQQAAAELQASAYLIEVQNQQVLHGPTGFEAMQAMSRMVAQVASPDFTIAGSEHGLVSAENPETKIHCLAGLHNTALLRQNQSGDEVLSHSLEMQRPDVIWMPHYHYVALCHKVLNSAYFRAKYDYFPGLYSYGLAIRKDSKYKDKVLAIAQYDHRIELLCPAIVLAEK